MADIDFDDFFPRIVAMEKEATVDDDYCPDGAEGIEYLAGTLDNFPYWTNGFGEITFDPGKSDAVNDLYIVRMRLIVAHYTEGYDGQGEKLLRRLLPKIARYFRHRPRMDLVTDSAAPYTTPPNYTDWRWRLEGGIGTSYFLETPEMPVQVGTEFRLRLNVSEYI